MLGFSLAGLKNLIVDPWFIDPLRKEGLDPLIIGLLLRPVGATEGLRFDRKIFYL
jgi:hypothetical protein